MGYLFRQLVSLCIIYFAMTITFGYFSVRSTYVGPLIHQNLQPTDTEIPSSSNTQISLGEKLLNKHNELIKNLTERVEELEQALHAVGLDRNVTVLSSRFGRRGRKRRTVGETGRGDTNQSEGQNGLNSGVSMNPYWIGQCILCPTGPPGPPGPIGSQGVAGRDGRDGRDASVGNPVIVETPNAGLPPPPTEIPETNYDHQSHDNSSGVIYTRWGRTECVSSAEIVYQGVVAGAHYTHAGSGANHLCLPLEPIYDRPWAGRQGEAAALIYGAEYQTGGFAPWAGLHDHEVPCAVCRAPSRTSYLMLPARNECPDESWTTEYAGWLVAAHHSHKRSEFVCMDKEPEAVPRTATNADGALFYLVEGRCVSNGGLPCRPYVDGYELTCAVCTR